jgi:hypothetical protein
MIEDRHFPSTRAREVPCTPVKFRAGRTPRKSAPFQAAGRYLTHVTSVNFAKIFIAAMAFVLAPPALANDSEAEVGIGGIALKSGSSIVMASEDLFVSQEKIRVTYRFENPTDKDVRTTVAFPLPGQPRAIMWQWYQDKSKRDWSDFAFSTKVNGKPVKFTPMELAVIGTRDVTAAVKASGLPFDWYLDEPFDKSVDALSDARRAALIKQGLLVKDENFNGVWVPAWDVATWFVREQVFPARSAITVEHEYTPIVGGAVGGSLYSSQRKENPEILADFRKTFCTDDAFIAGFDRKIASAGKGNSMYYGETWVSYVLSPGANWNGPIRDFRMVVDKGDPGNLVSFCMDGVKKITPTRFEVRKRDFTPRDELRVLILKFEEIGGGE